MLLRIIFPTFMTSAIFRENSSVSSGTLWSRSETDTLAVVLLSLKCNVSPTLKLLSYVDKIKIHSEQ